MHPQARRLLLSAATSLVASLPSTAQDGGSTFGHARTRQLAELGRLPTPAEIAVADLVNYHRHRIPLPRAGEAVALDLRFASRSCRPGEPVVLQLGIATAAVADRTELPPVDVALVVDCSGSMATAGKLDQVKRALELFANKLRPSDRVSLVTYSDEARVEEAKRAVGDGRWLRDAIARLRPEGSTNLHAGMVAGLRELARTAQDAPRDEVGRQRRVILLTDGIANRGVVDPEAILADACTFTKDAIDLSTIGVGHDVQTALLDRLARGSRGLFHFVADGKDIDKVFVKEAESLLAPAARGVRLELELPAGLEIAKVYGHEVEPGSGRMELDLPDLSRASTSVVLVECRTAATLAVDGRATVRARLVFREPASEAPRALTCSEEITFAATARDFDPEVRKNHTIARVAEGMRQMAIAATASRWSDADRALRSGLSAAKLAFPSAEDPDVKAIVEMATGHERTLARALERFRDY